MLVLYYLTEPETAVSLPPNIEHDDKLANVRLEFMMTQGILNGLTEDNIFSPVSRRLKDLLILITNHIGDFLDNYERVWDEELGQMMNARNPAPDGWRRKRPRKSEVSDIEARQKRVTIRIDTDDQLYAGETLYLYMKVQTDETFSAVLGEIRISVAISHEEMPIDAEQLHFSDYSLWTTLKKMSHDIRLQNIAYDVMMHHLVPHYIDRVILPQISYKIIHPDGVDLKQMQLIMERPAQQLVDYEAYVLNDVLDVKYDYITRMWKRVIIEPLKLKWPIHKYVDPYRVYMSYVRKAGERQMWQLYPPAKQEIFDFISLTEAQYFSKE